MENIFKTKTTNHAKTAQNEIVKHLESQGFKCISEYKVNSRGDDRSGRIDIVAIKGELKLAIEVDNVTPRNKSIFKLKQISDYEKIILLRNGKSDYEIEEIKIISL